MGAVKGVGEGPVEAIVSARQQHTQFDDLFDFCEKCDVKKLNKRVLEALIKCGALDQIGPSRAVMFAAIEQAVKAADQSMANANAGMLDLFGEMQAEQDTDPYDDFPGCDSMVAKRKPKGEKDTLGLYLTSHPIDEFEQEVQKMVTIRLGQLEPSKQTQTLAGLVIDVRVIKTKRGSNLAVITLDDRTGRTEITCFGEQWDEYKDLVQVDSIIVLEGDISFDEYSGSQKVKTKHIYSLQSARIRLIQSIRLHIDDMPEQQLQDKLNKLNLQAYENGALVQIALKSNCAQGVLALPDNQRLALDDESLFNMKTQFANSEFIYAH